jgi:transglutaminase-like putative cysteine protease
MLTFLARTLPFQSALLGFALLAAFAPLAVAKDDKGVETEIIQEAVSEPSAVRYGESIATRYKVGAKIKSKGGTVQNILVMVTVPLECPEQEVLVVEEDFSPQIENVEFRPLPDQKGVEPGARQMLITISQLPPKTEAHALITYEVITKTILPPEQTATLKIPARPERWLKTYLSSSPFINVGDRKIRDAVKAALAAPKKDEEVPPEVADAVEDESTKEPSPDEESSAYEEIDSAETPAAKPAVEPAVKPAAAKSDGLVGVDEKAAFQTGPPSDSAAAEAAPIATGDWERVEAIYDYVIDHVKYEEGAQDKSSVQALKDGKADCHGISALFVAMCRTAKVPARMVWVDAHQYAEFYLEDEAGKGHWYPVQSAGTRSFGEMPMPKVILQKGDNFRVPERRRERLRYASDFAIFLSTPKSKPSITYVREQL